MGRWAGLKRSERPGRRGRLDDRNDSTKGRSTALAPGWRALRARVGAAGQRRGEMARCVSCRLVADRRKPLGRVALLILPMSKAKQREWGGGPAWSTAKGRAGGVDWIIVMSQRRRDRTIETLQRNYGRVRSATVASVSAICAPPNPGSTPSNGLMSFFRSGS